MIALRAHVIELVRTRGYEHRDEPFTLASGALSHDYVDAKYAIDTGERLRVVSEAVIQLAAELLIEFDAVGGLTMGADALTHGVSMVSGCMWFTVRKEPKPRGRTQWIEGGRLGAEHSVLLVEDVVTTGGSALKAFDVVAATGATVAGVITLVDRGDGGGALFAARGVPYAALVTYRDLGIEPITAQTPN